MEHFFPPPVRRQLFGSLVFLSGSFLQPLCPSPVGFLLAWWWLGCFWCLGPWSVRPLWTQSEPWGPRWTQSSSEGSLLTCYGPNSSWFVGTPTCLLSSSKILGDIFQFPEEDHLSNRQKVDYSHTWNVAFFKTCYINVVSWWVTAAIKAFTEVIFYSGTPTFHFQGLCQLQSKELWRKVAKPVVVILNLDCCSFSIFTCLPSSVFSCVASTDLLVDCLLVTFFCVSSFDSKRAFKAWKEAILIWRLPMDLLRVNPVLEWDWSLLSFPLSNPSTWGFVVASNDIWKRNTSFL